MILTYSIIKIALLISCVFSVIYNFKALSIIDGHEKTRPYAVAICLHPATMWAYFMLDPTDYFFKLVIGAGLISWYIGAIDRAVQDSKQFVINHISKHS